MNNLLLPDLLAMLVLLGVLWLVRRRYPQHDIHVWMSALLLILLESVARILYGIPMSSLPHRMLHAIALDAYLLAGVLFQRSSIRGLQRLPRATVYTVLYTTPGLVLLTMYGMGVTGRAPYVAAAFGGIAVTVVTSLVLQRPTRYLLGLSSMWVPALLAAALATPRLSAYLLLAALYLATAGTFCWSLPRHSSGKVAVVIGFFAWGCCFAMHPWIATSHPQWATLASEIWNMQKFLITVGLLLVLFERQVENNEWLALHDQLTGLPNRRLFQDRLSSAIARAERDRTALILFYMDLNHFKEVNDTLGHDAGDSLLRQVSESLQKVVRRTDTLARMGGDEFMLLATDVHTEEGARKSALWGRMRESSVERRVAQRPSTRARDAAEAPVAKSPGRNAGEVVQPLSASDHDRILQLAAKLEGNLRLAVDQPVRVWTAGDARTVQVSASIGIASYPMDGTNPEELCRIADQRMFVDKAREPGSRGSLERMLSRLTTH